MGKKKVNLRNDIITIFSDYINWKHSKYRMSEVNEDLDWITLKEWVDARGTKSMKNSIKKLNLPITQGAENDRNTAQRERPNEKTDINEKTRCKIRNITGTSSFNEQQLIPGACTDTIVEEGGNANTATVGLMPMQKASKHVIPAEASVPLSAQNNEQTQNNEQQLIPGAYTDTIVEEGGNANTATVGLMPMQKASKHVIPAEASVPLLAQNNEQTQNNEQQLIPGAYTDTIVEESGNANTATVGLMPTQQTSNIEQVEVMPRDLITDRVPRARALARARLRRHPYIHINRCLSVFRNFLLHR